MYDPLLIVLSTVLILLVVIIGAFLVALTMFLLTLKQTLVKLQRAIDNVEDTAIRSLAPLLSVKAMFSDTQNFFGALRKVTRVIRGRKSR